MKPIQYYIGILSVLGYVYCLPVVGQVEDKVVRKGNPRLDADGDNIISPADLKAFCDFYDHLADDEYYELPQNVQNLDINLDGVINDMDYLLLMDAGAGEEELAAFKAEVDSARDVNSWVYI